MDRCQYKQRGILSPGVIKARAEAIEPRASFDTIPLAGGIEPGRTVFLNARPKINQSTHHPFQLGYSALILDPYRGTKVGRYGPDLWPISARNLMDNIYTAHFTLWLPENVGLWLFGIAALIWTIDCGVGIYLTFPLRHVSRARQRPPPPWLMRWTAAWKVRRPARGYKLVFDLHRAGSLWAWLLLLMMAWSSVALTLRREVYTPVMRQMFDMSVPADNIAMLPMTVEYPPIGMDKAAVIGRFLANREAVRLRTTIGPGALLDYDHLRGIYRYRSNSDAQPRASRPPISSSARSTANISWRWSPIICRLG